MSDTEKKLPEDLKEGIEDIRLANHAIRACVRLLAEDSINNGSQAGGPTPFIWFDNETQYGLMLAVQVCSQTIGARLDDLEEEKHYNIGWDGGDRPDEWTERHYAPHDDENFYRRVDQAIARGERDPLEVAMREAWAEHDQKLNGDTLNDDMPNEKTTIQ